MPSAPASRGPDGEIIAAVEISGYGQVYGRMCSCSVAQREPVGMPVDPLLRRGPEQREDRLERLLHHPALLDRIDAHHVRVGRQRARSGAEDHAAAGEVVEQHPAVGDHQRMVIRQRHHAGAEPDVLGPFGGRGDEHLRAGDQLVAAGVVLAEPHLVEPEPVQRDRAIEVVFQCDGGGLADRVERRDEHPEVQWTCPSDNSNLDKEVEQRLVDLVGPLLLQPVAGAFDHHFAVVAGDHLANAVARRVGQRRVGGCRR